MTRLLVDSETLLRLQSVQGPSELCDEFGKVLGYFLPAGRTGRSPFTDEQLKERRKQHTGSPLSEVLERIQRS